LEEDDEFQEFEGATWDQDFGKQDADDGQLWQDDWEDDDTNDDFIQQLRQQIAANPVPNATGGAAAR
jgi:26 proteasome complex subunit DSS1